jgi:hypothetical protein
MRGKAVLGALAGIVTAGVLAAQEPRWRAEVFGVAHDYEDFSGWGLVVGRGPDTGVRLELLLESRREESFVWEYQEGGALGSYHYGGADTFGLQLGYGRYWVGPTFYPFFTVSAGITVAQPDFGPVESKGYPAASIGGGFEVKLSEVWVFRLDGRAEWVGWQPDPSGWDCDWMGGGTCERRGGDFGFGGATYDSLQPVLRLGIGARW